MDTVVSSPPTNPSPGDVWYDTSTGLYFEWTARTGGGYVWVQRLDLRSLQQSSSPPVVGSTILVSRTPVCTTSSVPPNNPTPADLWYDTVSGFFFIFYDDGNTQQWVVTSPGRGGDIGPPGPLGPPGINWQGSWSSAETYHAQDGVVYNGSSYIALDVNTNAPPSTNPGLWDLLAQKGAQGDPGPPTTVNAGADITVTGTTPSITVAVTAGAFARPADLTGLAPLASPTFTGDPKAPTPATADNDTSIATTAYVKANIGAIPPADWGSITGKPSTFPPTLPITEADVTNLVTDLAAKAPLASPTFTGDPKSVTPATADNDTSIATTAFVKAQGYALASGAVSSVTGTAPVVSSGGLTPAISMAAATASVPGYLTAADWTTFNGKASLASPVFTGDPQAPTPATADNDTSIATTAFVKAQSYATTTQLALKADLASPVFTGNPTAPTPTLGDNDTSIATTAFVQTAIGGAAATYPAKSVLYGSGTSGSNAAKGDAAEMSFDETTNALTVPRAIHPTGTITTNQPAIDITQTWNAGAVTFEALKVNVTRTAAADPSYLARLQLGGSTMFSVDRFGTGIFTAGVFMGGDLALNTGNAIPASGLQDRGINMSTTAHFGLYYGSGAPTTVQARGSLYLRSDGLPYVNTDGATAWSQLVDLATMAGRAGKVTIGNAAGLALSSGADTVIVLTSLLQGNVGGYYNTSNGRWTPPAGSYTVICQATIQAPSAGNGTATVKVRKNGVVLTSMQGSGSAQFMIPLSLAVNVDVNGTDFIELVLLAQTSGMSMVACIFTAAPM